MLVKHFLQKSWVSSPKQYGSEYGSEITSKNEGNVGSHATPLQEVRA